MLFRAIYHILEEAGQLKKLIVLGSLLLLASLALATPRLVVFEEGTATY